MPNLGELQMLQSIRRAQFTFPHLHKRRLVCQHTRSLPPSLSLFLSLYRCHICTNGDLYVSTLSPPPVARNSYLRHIPAIAKATQQPSYQPLILYIPGGCTLIVHKVCVIRHMQLDKHQLSNTIAIFPLHCYHSQTNQRHF